MAVYGEKYYLGLDMGTNSVGWALTDEHYCLRRAKGKDLWGCRLFDNAKTSAERRAFRCARRRIQRERARIGTLMLYFSDEIDKVDPGFYQRLEESKYHLEDRSEQNQQKYALFSDKEYTDKDYYREYPTIFHLIKSLIDKDKDSYDVRLVFLALLNMFKHRGNFLNESLSDENVGSDISEAWQALCEQAELFDLHLGKAADPAHILDILGERGISKKEVSDKLCAYLGLEKFQKGEQEIVSLLTGRSVKLVSIYGEQLLGGENKKKRIGYRDSKYEEVYSELQELLGEEYCELLDSAKVVHDLGLLANILKGTPDGKQFLSHARVAAYEKHQEDLQRLKRVLRKYNLAEYNKMFRIMEEGNYSAYVGSVNSLGQKQRRCEGKGRSVEDLYKNIKKALTSCPEDDADVQSILRDVDAEIFLPKQLTSANGVIPNQIYVREMKVILSNAESYLPFLKERDEYGLTVSERILQLFSFRIPYYVGPLGQQHAGEAGYNAWAVRKKEDGRNCTGPVYPWNFEEIIDTKKTAEKFIERMVRHCSYMRGESCLPKASLLYEKFMVLNEINNIRIHGEKIPVGLKQDIYQSLYMKGKRVTGNDLRQFLTARGLIAKDDREAISGIDTEGNLKASLSSVGKFRGIFGDDISLDRNQEMIEKIIFWKTIYGDDRRFVREQIEEQYAGILTEQQIKRILGFKCSDWGRLSRGFLEMEGYSKKDGIKRTIIQALWETNDNLMMLLSEEYSYRDQLKDQQKALEKPLAEWDYKDLNGMYLSAPVRRMVWQTMKVVREITEITGHEPDRIFIEMPREEGEKNKRTVSRKKKLSDLYAALKNEGKEWQQEIDEREEAEFRSKKLYLYYMQMGRSMYTGKAIDLDKLLHDNTAYDIDHIYPRHFVKDDSIENNLVLVEKEINNHKQDVFPLERSLQNTQGAFWRSLVERHFITKEKYDRLTRTTSFTEEEKASFISRQLVETRQGTKAVTQIMQAAFPASDIVFSKAGVVSDFRSKYDIVKVRSVNDLHHAKDAYLNIVVGNAYYVKFTANPLRYIREAERNSEDALYQYNMDKIFERDIVREKETAWIGTQNDTSMIGLVKSMVRRNSPIISEKTYVAHGGHSDATIVPARKAKAGVYMAMSSDVKLTDVTKYGGKTAISTQCYCLVQYKLGKKRIQSLEAVPIFLGDIEILSTEKLLDYLSWTLQQENPKKAVSELEIKIKCIPFNTLVKVDGFYYRLGGRTGSSIYLSNAQSLMLQPEQEKYIKSLDRAAETGVLKVGRTEITTQENLALYDALLQKMLGAYENKKTPIYTAVQDGRDAFSVLAVLDQVKVLRNILIWFQLGGYTADLELIGGSKHAGLCRMSKKIGELNEFCILHQSVTGLYIRREEIIGS